MTSEAASVAAAFAAAFSPSGSAVASSAFGLAGLALERLHVSTPLRRVSSELRARVGAEKTESALAWQATRAAEASRLSLGQQPPSVPAHAPPPSAGAGSGAPPPTAGASTGASAAGAHCVPRAPAKTAVTATVTGQRAAPSPSPDWRPTPDEEKLISYAHSCGFLFEPQRGLFCAIHAANSMCGIWAEKVTISELENVSVALADAEVRLRVMDSNTGRLLRVDAAELLRCKVASEDDYRAVVKREINAVYHRQDRTGNYNVTVLIQALKVRGLGMTFVSSAPALSGRAVQWFIANRAAVDGVGIMFGSGRHYWSLRFGVGGETHWNLDSLARPGPVTPPDYSDDSALGKTVRACLGGSSGALDRSPGSDSAVLAYSVRHARAHCTIFLVSPAEREAQIKKGLASIEQLPVGGRGGKPAAAGAGAWAGARTGARTGGGARGGEGGATVGESSVRLNHVKLHHFAACERAGPAELAPLPHPDEGC